MRNPGFPLFVGREVFQACLRWARNKAGTSIGHEHEAREHVMSRATQQKE